jgi:sarcosine oxidase subunit beta
MPFGLLKYGLSKSYPVDRLIPSETDLKNSYDLVIVGAGGHGLAAAYYLSRQHGITNIAVLDKGYLAGGNTARNTAIVRANYLTPEGVDFYKESMALWEELSSEFNLNLLYSRRGHLALAGGSEQAHGRQF